MHPQIVKGNMKLLSRALVLGGLISLLSACSTFTTAETVIERNGNTSDIARCGAGLGIDNKLGLIIKTEAEKKGGEYSAALSSEVRAKVASEGLMTGDEKKYDAYLRCILELDKRRTDQKKSAQAERLQQPTLKVYRAAPKMKSEDGFARRVVVENTGDELTELQVMPAPFLYVAELCLMRSPTDCGNEAFNNRSLKSAYIPIVNYYSALTFRREYKGELYSQDEQNPSTLKDVTGDFTKSAWKERGQSMTDFVVTLVRIRYKDKFQMPHERYMDISIEQKELPLETGKHLFELRAKAIDEKRMIDGSAPSIEQLRNLWNLEAKNSIDLPEPWRIYKQSRQ
jgi:hypothetical protein